MPEQRDKHLVGAKEDLKQLDNQLQNRSYTPLSSNRKSLKSNSQREEAPKRLSDKLRDLSASRKEHVTVSEVTESGNSFRKSRIEDRNTKLSGTERRESKKTEHEQGLKPEIHDNHTKVKEEIVKVKRNTIVESENPKKKKILEKCEIFENGVKDSEIDKSRGRSSSILVSRADVEKSKQNRLVSIRRNRSLSEEPRKQFERERDRGLWETRNSRRDSRKDPEDSKDKQENIVSRESRRDKKTVFVETLEEENTGDIVPDKKSKKLSDREKGISFHDKVVLNRDDKHRKHSLDVNKLSYNGLFDNEHDSKLNPSLAWLKEKRKSVPTPHDIEKLMSTMEIEAAFSEILDAVETFPDEKSLVETVTAKDSPIIEEGSDSSGMEEDLNKNNNSVPNNEKTTHNEVKEGQGDDSGVENGENEQEAVDNNDLNNKNSAINQQSGNKPTGKV